MGGKDAGIWMGSAQASQPSSPRDSVLDMPAASAAAVDMCSQKQLDSRQTLSSSDWVFLAPMSSHRRQPIWTKRLWRRHVCTMCDLVKVGFCS